MEKLQKEIEACLEEEFYHPLFNLLVRGIKPDIKSVPVVAGKLMSLMTSLPNYGDGENNYCSQDLKIGDQIGKAIKFYRNKKKLTQSELAESVSISLSSVQKYEAGDVSIPLSIAFHIAKALEIFVDDLLSFGCDRND